MGGDGHGQALGQRARHTQGTDVDALLPLDADGSLFDEADIVKLSRRTFVAGSAVALSGCHTERNLPMPRLEHRTLASLPRTTLSWLSLRDHFGATLGPRTAQLISARSGMLHAEGNDTDQPTRMLQLWFRPHTYGGPPAYYSRQLSDDGRQLIAGDEGMPLRADVRVWWLPLVAGRPERLTLDRARTGYLLATTGPLRVEALQGGSGVDLALGEGAALGEGSVAVMADTASSALWIDLP